MKLADSFAILGIPVTRDKKRIKRAFRKRALELHPDTSQLPQAEKEFKALIEANDLAERFADGQLQFKPKIQREESEAFSDEVQRRRAMAREEIKRRHRSAQQSEHMIGFICRKIIVVECSKLFLFVFTPSFLLTIAYYGSYLALKGAVFMLSPIAIVLFGIIYSSSDSLGFGFRGDRLHHAIRTWWRNRRNRSS